MLSITGREVIQESYALSWDVVTCCWQLEGSAEEVALRGRKADVLTSCELPSTVRTSAIVTLSGVSQPNLSPILVRLVADGLVMEQKAGRAKAYRLTSEGRARPAGRCDVVKGMTLRMMTSCVEKHDIGGIGHISNKDFIRCI